MKKLWAFFVIVFFAFACHQQPQRAALSSEQPIVHGIRLSDNFDTYLNQIIELQERYPIENRKTLLFPIRIHSVNPLIGTALYEENFSDAIVYLNTVFQTVNIQFELVNTGNDYIYSERNIDAFYHNLTIEDFLTKKTYDRSVINLYVFDDFDDVLGYTHYPILNINRIFISKKHLKDAAFIHEVGHFFGLLHTFEKDITNASLVSNAGCLQNGDKICDTPPDPYGASFIEGDCTLFGEYKDGHGEHFYPNLGNYMSYYGSCRSHFTAQQSKRMYFIAKMIKYPQMRIKA